MLWHIELKFFILLCFTVLQIKFKFRQFASIFVGVMSLLELRILEIHSFPHFSLSCCDILSWNFAYDFTALQIKFECRQFASIFVGVMPLLGLRIFEIHSLQDPTSDKSQGRGCSGPIPPPSGSALVHTLTNLAEIYYLTLVSFMRFFEKSNE